MRRRTANQGQEAEVNMTPALDVVFILLIFFIVTAVFIKEAGFDVSQSNSMDPPVPDTPTVMIQIDEHNGVFLNKRRLDVRSIRANMEKHMAENPKTAAIIQTARLAKTETLVSVMDQIRQAGATISLKPLSNKISS